MTLRFAPSGPPAPAQVPTVTPATVPDGAYLLDVREADEWKAGRIPGAHHIPLRDVPRRLAEVPTAGDVVVVCRVGGRSAHAAAYLLAQGWDNVLNLAGGLRAWQEAGRPLVAEAEAAPRVL